MAISMISTGRASPSLPPFIQPIKKDHAFGKYIEHECCTLSNFRKRKHRTHLHIAVIVMRGKIIAIATNGIGSRSRGTGYTQYTIHAESAVLKDLGDLSLLKDADMYVFRLSLGKDHNEENMSRLSEPCSSCIKLIMKCHQKYGLRKVYYSV